MDMERYNDFPGPDGPEAAAPMTLPSDTDATDECDPPSPFGRSAGPALGPLAELFHRELCHCAEMNSAIARILDESGCRTVSVRMVADALSKELQSWLQEICAIIDPDNENARPARVAEAKKRLKSRGINEHVDNTITSALRHMETTEGHSGVAGVDTDIEPEKSIPASAPDTVRHAAGRTRRAGYTLVAGPPAPLLTRREWEVLALVSEALSNAQVASRLGITEGTVKRHLKNIFVKLGAVSRMDAVNKANARKATERPFR